MATRLSLEEVYTLHVMRGYSLRQLQNLLGVDRKTLAKRLRESGKTVNARGTRNLPSEVRKLTPVEWAYIAGFLDGEGSITCHSHKTPHYRCWITVSQVDPRPLYWLQERLGGKVYTRTKRRAAESRISSQWVSTRQRSTEIILIRCLPYLLVKREQAIVAIRLLRSKGNYERQAKLALELKDLKHRPWSLPTIEGTAE